MSQMVKVKQTRTCADNLTNKLTYQVCHLENRHL